MKKRPVIIWGHPLHTHTHSYIHEAFWRAFKSLGHETHWLWDDGDVPHVKDALVITEGQVDGNIPLRTDWEYLLHNCDKTKYDQNNIRYKTLQVYSKDVRDREVEKIADCEYYEPSTQTLYQPWATNLLPHEIDQIPLITDLSSQPNYCNWIGSVMEPPHGNVPELTAYGKSLASKSIELRVHGGVRSDEVISIVRDSYLAPAVLGAWQIDQGYIPCRIFKNISYGHLGITNSKHVNDLFAGKLVYHPDSGKLVDLAIEEFTKNNLKLRNEILEEVKNHHTYMNRIQNILDIMEDVK